MLIFFFLSLRIPGSTSLVMPTLTYINGLILRTFPFQMSLYFFLGMLWERERIYRYVSWINRHRKDKRLGSFRRLRTWRLWVQWHYFEHCLMVGEGRGHLWASRVVVVSDVGSQSHLCVSKRARGREWVKLLRCFCVRQDAVTVVSVPWERGLQICIDRHHTGSARLGAVVKGVGQHDLKLSGHVGTKCWRSRHWSDAWTFWVERSVTLSKVLVAHTLAGWLWKGLLDGWWVRRRLYLTRFENWLVQIILLGLSSRPWWWWTDGKMRLWRGIEDSRYAGYR